MSPPENANTFVGRLATFEHPRQLTKRRASSTKKRTATTVSWPHETPSPEDLARAGFYYSPDANHPDNVVCFMCDRKLDGWEPEDVPALEHLSHAPGCAWAINACLPLRDPDEHEDPMSEQMVAARTATFAGSWPHENKKGWKCKTKKMVEAGWCYDPSPDYEDGVACFYCMLSLDGWEPKDDPKEEHRKRSPDCPFMLIDVYAGARKATKGKKGHTPAASRAARLSIQSTRDFDTFSEAPSLMSLGDDAPHEGDSVLTTTSNATATSMARGKKGVGKGKAVPKNTRKSNRGKKAADEPSVVEIGPTLDYANAELSLGDLNAIDGDSAITTATTASKSGKGHKAAAKAKATKGTRKTTRTTKKTAVADSTLLDEPMAETGETEMEMESVKPAGRTTQRTSRSEAPSYMEQTSQLESHAENEPPRQRATRTRGGRKFKATDEESRLSNDASQLQSELEDAVARAAEEEPPKLRRGRKRTSDGAVKSGDSVVIAEEPSKPIKARRGRKAKTVEEEPAPGSKYEAEKSENIPPPKLAAKPKRGRKAKQVIEESALEATVEELPREPTPQPREATPVQESPEPTAEPSPEPSPVVAKNPTPAPREPTPPPKEATSSPSPQSSDAENRPPSSRVVSSHAPIPARAPLSARGTRAPLADASTPQTSPSKRSGNVIGGLSSTQPWETVDLENIFLQSPATKRIHHDNGEAMVKENGSNWEDLSLDEAVHKVRREMTSPEKKMTVEQWVQHQAEKGEQQLREQCERMVNIFETQGTKAMRALEGIRCSN